MYSSFFFSQDFLDWKWWVGGILTIVVAIIGLSANLMSVVVLVRPKIRSVAFNQLLVVLCVVDSLFLCCNSLSMGHALGLDKSKYILGSVKKYPKNISIWKY